MRLGTYFRKELLNKINIKSNSSDVVLDVGCFDGYWLSTQKAKQKYGLDIDIVKKYKNIKYIKASALDIPFPKNKFDRVFAFDVIEHVPENTEIKFLSELIRVTKPGGEIVITCPSNKIRIFPQFLTEFASKKWQHFKYPGLSRNNLTKYLSKFKEIRYDISDLNTKYFLQLYLMLSLLWRLNPNLTKKLILFLLDKELQSLRGNNGYYIIKIRRIK
jgi:ubiquinone/menaquinone biosynthesis C-methylase UbiE